MSTYIIIEWTYLCLDVYFYTVALPLSDIL